MTDQDQTRDATGTGPTLTVAISTRGARALALDGADWPRLSGVDYLVLAQEAEAPDVAAHLDRLAARDDVRVARLAGTGLSRSRNAALDAARGEVVLIADDDVTHPPGALAAIRQAFAADPALALLAGRSFDPAGRPRKRGGTRGHALRLWNSARISSHELAFRAAPVRAAGVRFDEAFGAGAGTATFLGEEYVFVADCLRAGLKGRYAPIPVSVHPPESSGFVWAGAAVARARAGIFGRVFGPLALPMRLAFGLKNARRFGSSADLWTFLRG